MAAELNVFLHSMLKKKFWKLDLIWKWNVTHCTEVRFASFLSGGFITEKTIFYRPKVSKNVQNIVLRFSRIDRERKLAIIIVHEKLICENLPLCSHYSFWTLLLFILIFRMKP